MYHHQEIEQKWQDFWKKHNTFKTPQESIKQKFYTLDMFPYPSGAGLHVGHPEGYTANDIVARYKHARGYNVLHPMGWDAFGLPAENYAIKTGVHPRITTEQNIATFKRQIQSLGFSYDWSREIDTTDPKYFQWTQWIFLKLFEAGLAYEQDLPINYCPSCKTGLANEEVLSDFTCERCGTKVEKKKIRQWVLAITKYAERLLADVDNLDWPEGIKDMQRNWIGKSEGCEFEMKKQGDDTKSIRVYTTRVDTVFGMTYAVIAPDHRQVGDFIMSENQKACESYIKTASQQSDQDRTADDKEKTGVFTGSYVINPYNNEAVPLWIADYVLGSYGTGAVMAVPAHDTRDLEFAAKYNLDIKNVITTVGNTTLPSPIGFKQPQFKTQEEKDEILNNFNNLDLNLASIGYIKGMLSLFIKKYNLEELYLSAFTFDGILVNSKEFSGLTSQEARVELTAYAEKNGFGHKKINYKLRDWLFSRQRYWGEPIPLIHLASEDMKNLPHISDISEVQDENIAYILKTEASAEEKNTGAICPHTGKLRQLVIGKKIFSKIYDGIYGKIVCDYRLPLELPQVEAYEPAGDGQSPLAKVPEFVHVKLAENLSGKRETNTMPQWGGSCWYYLRFMDVNNPQELVSKAAESYWGSVDSYVGGAEHAVLHLLYARFWHKFLYDIGVVSTIEPFHRLRNQGMILAYAYQRANGGLLANDLVAEKDGKFYEISTGVEVKRVVAKMSKSLKNVVNPDDIVKQFGADTLRLYEMYMGDFADTKPWDTTAIVGCRRFLDRVHALFLDGKEKFAETDEKAMKTLHKAIKKITEDIENYKFNTAIAQMMICINEGLPKDTGKKAQWKESFLKLLHPFAPHLAEECWENIKGNNALILKAYFATGNDGKIKRAQSIFDSLKSALTLEKMPELIEVEETGATPLACALQKIEVYKNKGYKIPVIVADTAVYFENQDFNPTHVRRAAIQASGKVESELTKMQIAELMIAFYTDIARKAGGKVDFYYIDAFAVLFPNGEIKTQEYKREYTLTDESKGDIYPDAPMRSLYISKVTGKRASETTMQDYLQEFACQADAFSELFGLGKNSIFFADWPRYDEALTVDSELTIGVQVLGKLRGEVHVGVDEAQDSVLAKAKANPDVAKWLEAKEIVKEIYVPGKIVNIVVK